ncbi:MAG: type I restriction endonuclease [Cyanobacteria bacterium P01_G01_bin.54]
MSTLIATKDLSLYDLEKRFGVEVAIVPELLTPWLQTQAPPTEAEKAILHRIRQHYLNLNRRRPLLEDLVKMVVLSPLLAATGFYDQDFEIKTEEKVEISIEDESTIIRGFMDILIIQEQLWLLVIETKRVQINVTTAIPQLLFYLLTNSKSHPTYGLATNGLEFTFLKLTTQNNHPHCQRSYALSLERDEDINQVFTALKHFGQGMEIRSMDR